MNNGKGTSEKLYKPQNLYRMTAVAQIFGMKGFFKKLWVNPLPRSVPQRTEQTKEQLDAAPSVSL